MMGRSISSQTNSIGRLDMTLEEVREIETCRLSEVFFQVVENDFQNSALKYAYKIHRFIEKLCTNPTDENSSMLKTVLKACSWTGSIDLPIRKAWWRMRGSLAVKLEPERIRLSRPVVDSMHLQQPGQRT